MTMIERVARALCQAAGEDPQRSAFHRYAVFKWQEYVPAAQAALTAMLDPPEEVLDALNKLAQCEGYVPEGWNNAIQTALKQMDQKVRDAFMQIHA